MTTRRTAATRRGRPPLEWLTPDQLRALPLGTAVSLDTSGRHKRLLGRITSTGTTLTVASPLEGTVELGPLDIKRGRQVDALYEPGDPVLKRGVDARTWRGGVVRTDGTDVLVEQLDGTFAWHPEDDLEPAEARDPKPPVLPRGPVPAQI